MKKIIFFALCLIMLVSTTSCSFDHELSKINIAGIDYCNISQMTVQAISQIWLEMGIESELRLTKGSVESANLLESQKVLSAILSQGVARNFSMECADAEDVAAYSNIRAGVVLSRRYSQAWTIRDDITNYMDFEGKIICVGPDGGSGKEYLKRILNALGVRPKKYIYADFDVSQEVLTSGRADVFYNCSESPLFYIERDIEQIGAKLISLTDTQIEMILNEEPIFVAHEFPKGIYGGAYEGVKTVGDHFIYCFSKNVPEDVVYSFVKSIYENSHILKSYSNEYDDFGPQYLNHLTIPLHNGAYRYYVEKGIWIPDSAKPVDGFGEARKGNPLK